MSEPARSSGILLHITSLPGDGGIGDLGAAAYHFVDWLASAGQTWWQVLPVNPPGMANSPYMSISAFAGSPLLVDITDLEHNGWLTASDTKAVSPGPVRRVDYNKVREYKHNLFVIAAERFFSHKKGRPSDDYDAFCAEHAGWLPDFALFAALNEAQGGKLWTSWPAPLVHRKTDALNDARASLKKEIERHMFVQWRFYEQWRSMREYASTKGIRLMGDLPIFVAHHSADVWVHQSEYLLDADGLPKSVAGVPPDYFSETGQRWGNPLYNWERMESSKFAWWKERMKAAMELYDWTRIDHFRGFEAYWAIPASEKTAVKGEWKKGPGEKLFRSLKKALGDLPIVAEDLGVITPEVTRMRDTFGLPGMKVLQFAFAGGPENGFLPHHHTPNAVVYTGTHDNDTTIGWYEGATEREKDFLRRYFQTDGHEVHWTLIRAALQSIANTAIVPMQDVLGMGSKQRMNLPGTTQGNWQWRFSWDEVQPFHAEKLYEFTALAGRCRPDRLQLVPFPDGKRRP